MSLFRPEVEALRAYALREPPLPVKLDQNESPSDWPGALKASAARRLAEVPFQRYPDFDEGPLTDALAARWGVPREGVLLGNGSNELLQALLLAAGGPCRPVALPRPSFSVYAQVALLTGTPVLEIPLDADFAYDSSAWDRVLGRERPALALVCSPNNPTGSVFPPAELEELLETYGGLLVVDEAYGEFAGESAASLLPRRENLLVLRTFSKAWSGAGIRLGYLLGNPRAVAQVRKAVLPYSVGPLTATLGLVALENAPLFEARVRAAVLERGRLAGLLGGLPGLRVFPSQANFLLVRTLGRDASRVHAELKERGVLVRDLSQNPGLEGCLRVTVGTNEEDDAVVSALAEVLR